MPNFFIELFNQPHFHSMRNLQFEKPFHRLGLGFGRLWRLGAAVLVWGSASLALAQATAPNQRAARVAAAPTIIDTTTEAAKNVGVKACLPAIQRLSVMSINGSRGNDVLVDWDKKNPATGPFFSLTGVEYQDGSFAVTMSAVPTADGRCTFTAERISVAPYACKTIAQAELVGYVETRLLPTFAVYTQAGDTGATVSMIDSPPGCLVIRRQVTYNWQPPTK